MKIDSDIADIIGRFREKITVVDDLQSTTPYPAIVAYPSRIKDTKVSGEKRDRLEIRSRLVIWQRWPDYCNTFEEVKTKGKADIIKLYEKLAKIIDILTSDHYTFGYEKVEATYNLMQGPKTEFRVFGVRCDFVILDHSKQPCCDDAELDLEGIKKWGR